MKLFFDTSALIPVFYADHPKHEESQRAFLAISPGDCCALHTLAEVYATLTGLPVRPRIGAEAAFGFVRQIRAKLDVVSLTVDEYIATLGRTPHIVGGAVFDALIAGCALKAGADALLTWNAKDFARLGPEVARLVRTPAEFEL